MGDAVGSFFFGQTGGIGGNVLAPRLGCVSPGVSRGKKKYKISKDVITEPSAKNVFRKMQQVSMDPPLQPSTSVFRVHETTLFINTPTL